MNISSTKNTCEKSSKISPKNNSTTMDIPVQPPTRSPKRFSPPRHSQPDERKDASPWKCFVLPKCKAKLGESSWSFFAERKKIGGVTLGSKKKGMIRMCFFVRFSSEASQSGKNNTFHWKELDFRKFSD